MTRGQLEWSGTYGGQPLDHILGHHVASSSAPTGMKETGQKWPAWQSSKMLSKKNIKARLSFARKNLDDPQDFWENTLWTDETKVEPFVRRDLQLGDKVAVKTAPPCSANEAPGLHIQAEGTVGALSEDAPEIQSEMLDHRRRLPVNGGVSQGMVEPPNIKPAPPVKEVRKDSPQQMCRICAWKAEDCRSLHENYTTLNWPCLGLNPLSEIITKTGYGYWLRNGATVSLLLYMDDIMLYAG
ncbi:hypothetical protein P4O66_018230, partial [Electrophorus voltai]